MTRKSRRGRQGPVKAAPLPDKYVLYEASFSGVDDDLAFVEGIYRQKRGRLPRLLREDFCGTALLACSFVRRDPQNRAWAIDTDLPTLEWGRTHHVARMGEAAARVTLLHEDVLAVKTPPVDVIVVLNYSCWIFRTRELLRSYFEKARRALAPDGVLVQDAFGGLESMDVLEDRDVVQASIGPDGERAPEFTYCWEQAHFNPIDHHSICHIHFEVPGHGRIERAFTYEWRTWTLPELRELLLEAGFGAVEVYVADADDAALHGSPDGEHVLRTDFRNDAAWNALIVALP